MIRRDAPISSSRNGKNSSAAKTGCSCACARRRTRRCCDHDHTSGAIVIAVIFEVWPAAGNKQRYLDLAASLREELLGIDGFLSIERFQSLTDPDKLLSLSFWRDEEAVREWRNRG